MRQWIKGRGIALLMALVMLITILPANEASAKASKKTGPALKDSSVTLYLKGDYATTYRLQVDNLAEGAKISYSSSDAKIAKVSQKGLITPLKKGSTTVTATVKQKGKTYRVKQIPLLQSSPFRRNIPAPSFSLQVFHQ